LLTHLVPKFLKVHTVDRTYDMLYTRYKDAIELLPREAHEKFRQFATRLSEREN
jgi:hypothetical protein